MNNLAETNQTEITTLVEFVGKAFPDIAKFIVENKQSMELHKSKKIVNLNKYPRFELYND